MYYLDTFLNINLIEYNYVDYFKTMKLFIILLAFLTIFSINGQIVGADSYKSKPLRALLYCYLPTMNPKSIV